MDLERLIELVRVQEYIYNHNDKHYHDTHKKDAAWKVIGEKLGQTDKDCKKQWTSLRDGFRRNLKKRKTKTGDAASTTKKWKFEDEMNFLLPYLRDRQTVSSLNISASSNEESEVLTQNDDNTRASESIIPENTENADFERLVSDNASKENTTSDKRMSSVEIQRPLSAKRKAKPIEQTASALVMKYLLDNKKEKQDETETLFYSLAQTVKKMDPYHRALAKSKVCSIVGELEIQCLSQQSRPPSAYTTSTPSPAQSYVSYSSTNVSTALSSPTTYEYSTNDDVGSNPQPSTSQFYQIFSSGLDKVNY